MYFDVALISLLQQKYDGGIFDDKFEEVVEDDWANANANIKTNCSNTTIKLVKNIDITNVKSLVGVVKFLKYALLVFSIIIKLLLSIIPINTIINTSFMSRKKF